MRSIIDKFVYDLSGKPLPTNTALDYELDRLFFTQGNVGEPNFLVEWDEKDQLGPLDSEVISQWLRRKFEPALILMLIHSDENYHRAKTECSQGSNYKSIIDMYLRFNFLERKARQRVDDICFDDDSVKQLDKAIMKLKRTLTFISNYLQKNASSNMTLLNTEAYSKADITLYNYLKRIVVGKYKDFGLRTHIKLCEPLVKFMSRYESKNPHVEPAREDTDEEEPTLIQEISKLAIVATGLLLFFLWRRG